MTLTIVGLGPGHIDDLSRRAWNALDAASTVILRTREHPCVPYLPHADRLSACDDLYQAHAKFEDVYAAIVERVITAARAGDVVYAVPGDPMVAESTVIALLERAKSDAIALQVINGISFIEPALVLIGADAVNGLQIHDAISIARAHHPALNPDYPALLAQVYNREMANDLKLTLMNQYPDDFPVTLIHGAGTPDGHIERVPLYAIDRSEHIAYLTALFIPAAQGLQGFEALQETIAHLRAPEGCPWDREQTHQTLRKHLLEETYEVLEAIDTDDADLLREELGDVLLQVVLHTQIATEMGEFYMSDVIGDLNRKLIRRHPHVWGDVQVGGTSEVLSNWDQIKKGEHKAKGKERKSLLDGVPKALPALAQAYEYTAKAAKPGFDWKRIEDVFDKVREELNELIEAKDEDHVREEFGDLLFVLANWARWLKLDPEIALREANAKFYRRFTYIEEHADRDLKSMTLEEMDALWNQAKAQGL